jgi:hypothetical protein
MGHDWFAILIRPLQVLGDGIGLSPALTLLVVSLLAAGSYVQWTFRHYKHDDHDD